MTVERMARTIEPPNEPVATSESPGRAIVGATLTFIALVALWQLLVREYKIPGWISQGGDRATARPLDRVRRAAA
jgi:hypothetical protein